MSEEYVREQLLEESKQENDQAPLMKQSDSIEEKYGNNRGKESPSHQNKIPLSVSSEEANENTEEMMADTGDNNNESTAAEAVQVAREEQEGSEKEPEEIATTTITKAGQGGEKTQLQDEPTAAAPQSISKEEV